MFTYRPQFVSAIIFGSCLSAISVAQPRIVGGDIVQDRNAYPWQAALVERDDSREEPISVLEGQFCGGTLIHPRWVLTAAHCVFRCDDYMGCLETGKDNLDVVFGVLNLRTDEGERVSVKRIVVHPDYYYSYQSNGTGDIALIELERAVNRPTVSLLKKSDPLEAPGVMATTIGWGNTSDLSKRPTLPDELRQVSVPIVANDVCQTAATEQSYTLSIDADAWICAGFAEGGKDACNGDSGGPLLVSDGTGWKQAGIVSFGVTENCAELNAYGVYTRVSTFFDFISETVCDSSTASFADSLFTNPIPNAPVLTLTVDGNVVTGSWPAVSFATGYELFYAPYPDGIPVQRMDIGNLTSYAATLASGQNFYVALRAYNGFCHGHFSNITYFVMP